MKKNIMCGLLYMFLIFPQIFAQQITDFEWEVYYDYGDPGIIITRYLGTNRNVAIPDMINGIPVRVIGEGVFQGNQLTNINIPNSIIVIAEFAFNGNQLTSIGIPNSVVFIGDFAFDGNQLSSIYIPNGVVYIREAAFSNNRLKDITIPDSVTAIGSGAFSDNQLTSITIPSSVTHIGHSVFIGNPVTNVIVGENIMALDPDYPRIANQKLGIFGIDISFEQAYISAGILAGTYTRPNVDSTIWTRQ